MNGPKYGVDTKVLDYLMKQRQPSVDIYGPMAASMAEASSAMGTLGGKAADASSIRRQVEQQQAAEMQGAQARQSQANRLAQYLQDVKGRNVAREQKLADVSSARDYERDKIGERREYESGKLGERREFEREERERQRATGMEDWKEREDYKARRGLERDLESRKISQGLYDQVVGEVPKEEDSAFSEILKKTKLGTPEKKALKQVAYRYQTLRGNTRKVKDIIENVGTFELTGPESSQIDSLMYEIAVDFAKIVDPESVARGGEVAAAQKYLLNVRPWGGLGIKDETAQQLLDDHLRKLDMRLQAKLQQEGLGGVEIVKSLADQADKLYGYEPSGGFKPGNTKTRPDGVEMILKDDGLWYEKESSETDHRSRDNDLKNQYLRNIPSVGGR